MSSDMKNGPSPEVIIASAAAQIRGEMMEPPDLPESMALVISLVQWGLYWQGKAANRGNAILMAAASANERQAAQEEPPAEPEQPPEPILPEGRPPGGVFAKPDDEPEDDEPDLGVEV